MITLEKIQKKVHLSYTLKHYFSSFSDEFSKFDYSKKLELLQEVVQKGFSTYDLSEIFRKSHESNYTHEDIQKELVKYISYVLYNNNIEPLVLKYYEGLSDKEVSIDLDAFLLSNDCYEDFKKKVKVKLGIEL